MDPNKWIPVLHEGGRWYEDWHVGDPSVVFVAGKYYMAYSATSKPFSKREGYPANMVQCVMGAVSENGIQWETTDEPLLIRGQDTADPKPESGRIGDFHRPSLRRIDRKWRLWFVYWLPGKGICMGYAENGGDFTHTRDFKIQHDLGTPHI